MRRFLTLTGLCAVALSLALSGQEAPGRAAPTATQRASERIRALQREAEALVAQESQLLVELRKLELDRQIKVEEVASIGRQQTETTQRLNESAARAETLKKIADADRPDIEARLVHLYRLGRAGYWRLLLDVDDLRSLGRVYRTAAAMTRLGETIQPNPAAAARYDFMFAKYVAAYAQLKEIMADLAHSVG